MQARQTHGQEVVRVRKGEGEGEEIGIGRGKVRKERKIETGIE